MENLNVWIVVAVAGIWLLAAIITSIWYLVASLQANWLLTLLSFFIPFVGLFLLIKHWEDLGKPFLINFFISILGIPLILLGAPSLTKAFDLGLDHSLQAEVEEEWGGPNTRYPDTWQEMNWEHPDVISAAEDLSRAEYAAVIKGPLTTEMTLQEYGEEAAGWIHRELFIINNRSGSNPWKVNGYQALTTDLSGIGSLPILEQEQQKPFSARLVCVDCEGQYFSMITWRTEKWDQQTNQTFIDIFRSFGPPLADEN